MPTALRSVRPCPVELVLRVDEAFTRVRARESARYVRVRPGVYAERSAWAALPPWQRYLARVHAHALRHPGAVYCLESAAALLGLPLFGEPRDVHLYDPHAGRAHRSGDVSIHVSAQQKAISLGAIATTSWADTAVDLLRVLPPAFALAVGDACVRLDPFTTVAGLRETAAAQPARRGTAQLAWLWPRIDARAESVGESVSRAVIEWSGFAAPDLQVWFGGEGVDDRFDFFWRRERLGGESDGYGKYLVGADPLDVLKREKTREDRLRRQMNGLARWDYADAMRVAPLQRKLAQAGVARPHPEQQGMLRTLALHPRSL